MEKQIASVLQKATGISTFTVFPASTVIGARAKKSPAKIPAVLPDNLAAAKYTSSAVAAVYRTTHHRPAR